MAPVSPSSQATWRSAPTVSFGQVKAESMMGKALIVTSSYLLMMNKTLENLHGPDLPDRLLLQNFQGY